MKDLIRKILKEEIDSLSEKKSPGLWANIRAKKARGEKPAHKNSKEHKDAVKSGKKINAEEVELQEAEYQGRKVKLNKPTRGDVKKFKVYVKNDKGNVVKVNFGHGGTSAKKKGEKTMRIRKSNPEARKSFRARHNCDNPGPKWKARYWSCKKW
jgi:hypothetical protein